MSKEVEEFGVDENQVESQAREPSYANAVGKTAKIVMGGYSPVTAEGKVIGYKCAKFGWHPDCLVIEALDERLSFFRRGNRWICPATKHARLAEAIIKD